MPARLVRRFLLRGPGGHIRLEGITMPTFNLKCESCGKPFSKTVSEGKVIFRFSRQNQSTITYAVVCPHCGHTHRVTEEYKGEPDNG